MFDFLSLFDFIRMILDFFASLFGGGVFPWGG